MKGFSVYMSLKYRWRVSVYLSSKCRWRSSVYLSVMQMNGFCASVLEMQMKDFCASLHWNTDGGVQKSIKLLMIFCVSVLWNVDDEFLCICLSKCSWWASVHLSFEIHLWISFFKCGFIITGQDQKRYVSVKDFYGCIDYGWCAKISVAFKKKAVDANANSKPCFTWQMCDFTCTHIVKTFVCQVSINLVLLVRKQLIFYTFSDLELCLIISSLKATTNFL